ncbi:hypothetical protein [Hyphomicrobium sp.]|uniref:hypothetical protein n=1 Tax=Hyphomicrobium sp. TaxID=82 RepID=UPI0025BB826B|nr:hypothetical protein [Hyphomicrobium sp.]
MQKKPVSLKVYRNFQDKKRRAKLKAELQEAAKFASEMPELAGYVVIAINQKGECGTLFDAGPILPAVLPAYVQEMLQRAVYSDPEEAEFTE